MWLETEGYYSERSRKSQIYACFILIFLNSSQISIECFATSVIQKVNILAVLGVWSCEGKIAVVTSKEISNLKRLCYVYIIPPLMLYYRNQYIISRKKFILDQRHILSILHASYCDAVQKHCFQYMCLA